MCVCLYVLKEQLLLLPTAGQHRPGPTHLPSRQTLGTARRWITVHLSLETERSRPSAPAEGTRNNAPSCQWEGPLVLPCLTLLSHSKFCVRLPQDNPANWAGGKDDIVMTPARWRCEISEGLAPGHLPVHSSPPTASAGPPAATIPIIEQAGHRRLCHLATCPPSAQPFRIRSPLSKHIK